VHTEGEHIDKDILFDLAMWHAYAKLRLHTDTTLNDFRALTTTLEDLYARSSKKSVLDTLPPNSKRNGCPCRREATLAAKRSAKRADTGVPEGSPGKKKKKSTPKKLNLSTYKYHALGDYPDQIASFGTTDNSSTQTVRIIS